MTVGADAAVTALSGGQFDLNGHALSVIDEIVSAALIAQIAPVFRVVGIDDLAQSPFHAEMHIRGIVLRGTVIAFPELFVYLVGTGLKERPIPVTAQNLLFIAALIALLKVLPVVVFLREKIGLPLMDPLRTE